jgi:pimeloyl-ACP methyl ester carboxylesterase
MKRKIVGAFFLFVLVGVLGSASISERLFEHHEKQCLELGWKQVVVQVNGKERKLLWKAPTGPWKGAIVALHGGGGTYSNFGSNIKLGKPMVEFGDLALARGFAVFAPDSGVDLGRDENGLGYGKRWDCMALNYRENADLPFMREVLETVVPGNRPAGSRNQIFVTGISNGGFMATLTATHYPDLVTAFAPISCGDPYGTYIDAGTSGRWKRKNAPGTFRDNDSGRKISEAGAAASEQDENEVRWPQHSESTELPPFKQFHHKGDVGVDISCATKSGRQLRKHGYPDKGAFILEDSDGRRTLFEHFWMSEYNEPLLEFFESCR